MLPIRQFLGPDGGPGIRADGADSRAHYGPDACTDGADSRVVDGPDECTDGAHIRADVGADVSGGCTGFGSADGGAGCTEAARAVPASKVLVKRRIEVSN